MSSRRRSPSDPSRKASSPDPQRAAVLVMYLHREGCPRGPAPSLRMTRTSMASVKQWQRWSMSPPEVIEDVVEQASSTTCTTRASCPPRGRTSRSTSFPSLVDAQTPSHAMVLDTSAGSCPIDSNAGGQRSIRPVPWPPCSSMSIPQTQCGGAAPDGRGQTLPPRCWANFPPSLAKRRSRLRMARIERIPFSAWPTR